MEENMQKKVDESWKEAAKKEVSESQSRGENIPEVDFLNFISSLGLQAMIFVGEIPSPLSNKIEQNLAQAKFIIDTLLMLREKTANNLSAEEAKVLDDLVYALQLKFVQRQNKGNDQTGGDK